MGIVGGPSSSTNSATTTDADEMGALFSSALPAASTAEGGWTAVAGFDPRGSASSANSAVRTAESGGNEASVTGAEPSTSTASTTSSSDNSDSLPGDSLGASRDRLGKSLHVSQASGGRRVG